VALQPSANSASEHDDACIGPVRRLAGRLAHGRSTAPLPLRLPGQSTTCYAQRLPSCIHAVHRRVSNHRRQTFNHKSTASVRVARATARPRRTAAGPVLDAQREGGPGRGGRSAVDLDQQRRRLARRQLEVLRAGTGSATLRMHGSALPVEASGRRALSHRLRSPVALSSASRPSACI